MHAVFLIFGGGNDILPFIVYFENKAVLSHHILFLHYSFAHFFNTPWGSFTVIAYLTTLINCIQQYLSLLYPL